MWRDRRREGQASACPRTSRRSSHPAGKTKNLRNLLLKSADKKQGNAFTLKIANHCVVATRDVDWQPYKKLNPKSQILLPFGQGRDSPEVNRALVRTATAVV